MITEVQFQSRLRSLIRNECGGEAFKVANKFAVGLPDPFIKIPGQHPIFVEVKREIPLKSGKDRSDVAVKLSDKQRRVIRDFHAVGMPAGWLVFIPESRGNHRLISGVDPWPERWPTSNCVDLPTVKYEQGATVQLIIADMIGKCDVR